MCVALALTPDAVCFCLLVSYLAHRLSGSLCTLSCQGLCVLVLCLLCLPRNALWAHNLTSRPLRLPALYGERGIQWGSSMEGCSQLFVRLCCVAVDLSRCKVTAVDWSWLCLAVKTFYYGWHWEWLWHDLCSVGGHQGINRSIGGFSLLFIYFLPKRHFQIQMLLLLLTTVHSSQKYWLFSHLMTPTSLIISI